MVLGWTQHYFRKRKFQKNVIDDRHNKKINSDACDYNILYVHVHILDIYIHYKQKNYKNNKTKDIIQQTTDCKKQKKDTHTTTSIHNTDTTFSF